MFTRKYRRLSFGLWVGKDFSNCKKRKKKDTTNPNKKGELNDTKEFMLL